MTPQILQVVTDTDRRGAQVFATDLHMAFEAAGRQVRTVALAPGSTGGLDLPVLGSRRMDLATLRALRQELAHCSVVIAHGSSTLPVCALASIANWDAVRVPTDQRFAFLGSERSAPAPRQRGLEACSSGRRFVERVGDDLARALGCTGITNPGHSDGVPVEHFRPASAGERATQRRVLGLDAERATFLCIGALVPEKGVDLAVDVVAQLDEAQLLVVGDGPERATLEELARDVAPKRVVFAGTLEDARRAYAAADVVVLPSRGGDSMPAVLIEAGLSGLPVVSTGVEAIPEIVIDGVSGRIVPCTRKDLLDALARMATDAGVRADYGRAARADCLHTFGIERVSERWLASLRDLGTG